MPSVAAPCAGKNGEIHYDHAIAKGAGINVTKPEPTTTALYVATNLATYEPANLEAPMPQEIKIDGYIVFRRVDSAYCAYLAVFFS